MLPHIYIKHIKHIVTSSHRHIASDFFLSTSKSSFVMHAPLALAYLTPNVVYLAGAYVSLFILYIYVKG